VSLAFRPICRQEYEQIRPWGISTSIDLHDCDPATIRDRDLLESFTHRLCELLNVTRFGPTQLVRFGSDPAVYGYSMVQLIETSLVSAHFAETSNAVYLDTFSCAYYDAAAAVEFAKQFFRSEKAIVYSNLRQ
jgi:S-adenosylmethionine/arginine decarboxylase-like enzyme